MAANYITKTQSILIKAELTVFHKKRTPCGVHFGNTGNDLGSRLVSKQVYSALRVFTSVFGMRTGVAPLLKSPVMVECFKVHSQPHIYNTLTIIELICVYDLSVIINMIKPSTY